MARNVKEIKVESKSSIVAPELSPGAYPARVVSVIFLGVQEQRPFMGEEKKPVDEVRITYELSDEFMQDEEGADLEDKPRWFSEDIAFYSLNADRAKSTKRYNAIDPTDSSDGDFFKLLGMPCQVVLINNPGKGKNAGKVYTNIADVTPAPKLKGYVQGELINKTFTFDPQDEAVTKAAFDSIPEWIRTKIVKANDYKGSALSAVLGGTPAPEETASPKVEDPKADDLPEDEMY